MSRQREKEIKVTPITAAESRPSFGFFQHDHRAGAIIGSPGEAESGSAGTQPDEE